MAFCKAIDISLEKNVDFIIISGDLFNTAQPGMEYLRATVEALKRCHDHLVPIYIISGSHDYSPSGKTMLDILEAAGLCINVAKGGDQNGKLRLAFYQDTKTKVKLTGVVGRKGSLERHYFANLDLDSLESEPGQKLFVFHSAVTELRPRGFEEVESVPLSCFPKGFLYYAGGHIHHMHHHVVEEYGLFGIPGPIFPNNFQELERLCHGGFFIYDRGEITFIPLPLYPVHSLTINANGKSPAEIEAVISKDLNAAPSQAIITIRLEGTITQGKISDISWTKVQELALSRGALCILRNTAKLSSLEFTPIQVSSANVEELEQKLITEHAGQSKTYHSSIQEDLIKNLMHVLCSEKEEGETQTHFEERITSCCEAVLPHFKEKSVHDTQNQPHISPQP